MTNIKPWKEPFMIQTKENCCKNCFSLVRELVTPGIKINMHYSQNLQLCCSWASKLFFLLTWGAVADDISKWTGCEL